MDNYDVFGELISPPILKVNPLVYRLPHKSAISITPSSSFSRKYDFQEFITLTPNAIYLYSRNMAVNTSDYTQEWLSKGAFFKADGTLDKSQVVKIPKSNSQYGIISNKANKNVQRCIDWMVHLATDKPMMTEEGYGYTFRLNFITLTLSSKQKHTDTEIKKLLFQPFLNYLRKKTWHDADGKPRALKYYFWRAEAQENCNIHFHLCTDIYIDKKIIQYEWNRFQNKIGYNSIDELKYKKGVAPSTHVRSIHAVKKIAKYLSKYCGKNSKGVQILAYSKMHEIPQRKLIWTVNKKKLPINFGKNKTKFFRPIFGKLWSCSENLSRLKKNSIKISDEIKYEISLFKSKYSHHVIENDFCTIININSNDLINLEMPNLRQLYINHCKNSLNPIPILTPPSELEG